MDRSSVLQKLPTELLQCIIAEYAKVASINEMWRTREVCKSFHDNIRYEIIHKVSIESFIPKAGRSGTSNLGLRILERNTIAVLQSPQRTKAHVDPVNKLVQAKIDAVLAVTPHTNLNALKQQYRSDVILYLARAVKDATLRYMTDGFGSQARRYYGWMRSTANEHDALVCAAAVGNLPAVKYPLGLVGPDSRLAFHHPAETLHPFVDPLLAASSTGKLDIVEYLLERITYQQNTIFLVDKAIGAATKAKSKSVIRALAHYIQKRAFRDFGYLMSRQGWLEDAVQTGDFGISCAVLEAVSRLSKGSHHYWIELVFEFACRHGRTNIIKDVVKLELEKTAPITQSLLQRGPIEAAKHARTQVIDLLLRLGADISLEAPVKEAIFTGRAWTLKYMLERGAQITQDLWGELDCYLENLEYQGPRSLESRRQVLSFYVAGKVAATMWPEYMKEMVTLEMLMDDVEDSARLSEEVEKVLGKDAEGKKIGWVSFVESCSVVKQSLGNERL